MKTPRTEKLNEIFRAIDIERRLQDRYRDEGRFAYTCASPELSAIEKLTIVAEEFGEVAHEVNEGIGPNREVNVEKLRKELIQTAAVAVAWVESLGVPRDLCFASVVGQLENLPEVEGATAAERFYLLSFLYGQLVSIDFIEPEARIEHFAAGCVQWLETL
jgi:NTP pyrophosphatase (non-canonical NTP hydrolase)